MAALIQSLMSSVVLPSRERCIHITDNTQQCQCPWFVSLPLDPYICGQCGHGIHAHVDYVSMVVNHHPPAQCAAYVQKTPLAQRCTCEAQLCDHIVADNAYRIGEPWNVLDNSRGNNVAFHGVDVINFSNDIVNSTFTPFVNSNANTDTFSRDANLTPVTAAPIFSPSPRHAFSPTDNAGNIPPPPPTPSLLASSTPPGIQSDVTQAEGYNPDHYFVQYPGYSMDNPYAHQADGGATGESFGYQYHSPHTEAGSDPYI
ncbi:uncharacterized protein EV420DRAFT_1770602 [Desarmillaria tabescens]|uniref:Uncharacterized protein n=1 Tax=Armillaria tabescens TaxID=1929756 RepID=A0AA39J3H0_ARMTA|nr:uncharacterized protein EV420DRAFT_1770602 [Desarmillaria tabescens]KAK0435430.1 hypothetical protein EV420DRAFT_1770602 [Desarmillaria tabescens]